MRLRRWSVDRRSVSSYNSGSREFHPFGEGLEDRTLPSGSPSSQAPTGAQPTLQTIPLVRNSTGIWSGALEMNGTIGLDGQDFFQLSPKTGDIQVDGGRLVVQLQSEGETQVILRQNTSGAILVESDAPPPGGSDSRIDMHVDAEPLDLEVNGPVGLAFSVSVTFTPATAPGQPVEGDETGRYAPILAGDFNSDAIPDLVTPTGVNLGIGDGTFQPVPNSVLATPGGDPSAMISGDFNSDGRADIAIADASAHDISIFNGLGNGTFAAPVIYPVAATPIAMAVGAFSRDGRTDLAVVEDGPGEIQIFQNVSGAFQAPETLPLGSYGIQGEPTSIAKGVFGGNQQGLIDLAVTYGESASGQPGGVLIFPGNGNGTFDAPTVVRAGINPVSVVVADFNRDGIEDLAVADQGDISNYANFSDFANSSTLLKLEQIAANASSLSTADLGGLVILLGQSNGRFTTMPTVSAGFLPQSLLVGDFTGNENTDIVVLHGLSVAASLFLGNGDGTLQQPIQVVPSFPAASVATGQFFGETAVMADFNGDCREDLAMASTLSSVVPTLLGDGNGQFEGQSANATGDGPISVAVDDFNGDGIPDLAVVDALSSDVTILVGQGNGSFVVSQRISTALFPTSVAVGDFNGDGRQDLVVTEAGASSVTVFLGNGDGTFVQGQTYHVGVAPTSVVVGDFTGNKIQDFAVANADAGSNSISVFLGNGEGTFRSAGVYAVGQEPVSIAAGDFEADGLPDLVVANLISNTVSILRNLGNGLFAPAVSIPVGLEPDSVAVCDLNRDGIPDVAVTNAKSGSVSVLLGEGKKTSWGPGSLPLVPLPQEPISVTPDSNPISLVIGDFSGDGIKELAITDASNFSSGYIDILSGPGDGTFPRQQNYAVASLPVSIAAGSFLGVGLPDLAVTQLVGNDVAIWINQGNSFSNSVPPALASDSAPLFADLQGNGTTDVISLVATGDISWRPILAQGSTTIGYGSPTRLNPGRPSRGIVLIDSAPTPVVASLAVGGDEVDLFGYRNGNFVLVGTLSTPPGSTQIFCAGNAGNGQSELLVTNPVDGTIAVLDDGLDAPSGPVLELKVDPGLSDLVALPEAGTYPMMVMSNAINGELQVLTTANHFLSSMPRYAAGTGLFDYSSSNASSPNDVTSLAGVTGLAAGDFNRNERPGLVTITPGSDQFNFLPGLGEGLYGNPVAFDTAGTPLAIAVGNFTGDGLPDVAILESNEVEIFLNNGQGGFDKPRDGSPGIPIGFDPTSLTVADLNGGLPDLIVSNSFGDILVFVDDGDGSFSTPSLPNPQMGLAIDPAGGAFVITDEVTDRVALQQPGTSSATTLADIANSLHDPGPPVFADLNGDGMPDLIYADGGGDDVRVYLRLGDGLFQAPVDFAVGTDPVGVTVAYLDGNQAPPDLIVANEGSNDISILIGKGTGAAWTLIDGPRLRVGAGPTATSVGDLQHNGVPDLVVSDSLANDVRILPGLADGFFKDQDPTIIPTGQFPGGPVTVPLGNGSAAKNDIAVPDSGSNTITLIDGSTFESLTFSSEGMTPVSLLVENDTTLLVANEGDGHLGMIELNASGDLLSATYQMDSQLLHLSALALDDSAGLTLYATNEGEDIALLFPLGLTGPLGNPLSPGIEPPSNPDNPYLTQFSGELDSAAAFTPTLVSNTILPVSLLLMDATMGTTAAASTATAAALSIGLGQPGLPDDNLGQDHEPGGETPEESLQPAPGSALPVASPPQKFTETQVLEKAFDEARRQIRAELTSETGPGRDAAGAPRYNPSIIENATEDSMKPQRRPSSDEGGREVGSHLLFDEAIDVLMEERPAGPATMRQRTSPAPGTTDGAMRADGRHRLASLSAAILHPWAAVILAASNVRHTPRCRSSLRCGRGQIHRGGQIRMARG
jgi:large repetitive protein